MMSVAYPGTTRTPSAEQELRIVVLALTDQDVPVVEALRIVTFARRRGATCRSWRSGIPLPEAV